MFILGDVEMDCVLEDVEDLFNMLVYNELYQMFFVLIVYYVFLFLCGIMGSKYMESLFYNYDFIWNFCCSYDVQLFYLICEDIRVFEEEEDGEEIGDYVVGGIEILVVDGGVEELFFFVKDDKEVGRVKKRFRFLVWKIGRKFFKIKDVLIIL